MSRVILLFNNILCLFQEALFIMVKAGVGMDLELVYLTILNTM